MNLAYVIVRRCSMDGFILELSLSSSVVVLWASGLLATWLRNVVGGWLGVVLDWLVECWCFGVYTIHLFS